MRSLKMILSSFLSQILILNPLFFFKIFFLYSREPFFKKALLSLIRILHLYTWFGPQSMCRILSPWPRDRTPPYTQKGEILTSGLQGVWSLFTCYLYSGASRMLGYIATFGSVYLAIILLMKFVQMVKPCYEKQFNIRYRLFACDRFAVVIIIPYCVTWMVSNLVI